MKTPPNSIIQTQELPCGISHFLQAFCVLLFWGLFLLASGCNNGVKDKKQEEPVNNTEKIFKHEFEKQGRFVFTHNFYRYTKLGDSCYSDSSYLLAAQYYEKAILLSDSLYKRLTDSLASNTLLYQDIFCSLQFDGDGHIEGFGQGINKEWYINAAVKSEQIDLLINLIREDPPYTKCNGNDTNFSVLRKNPALNVFINKAVNTIQQEQIEHTKEEEKKYAQPLNEQSEAEEKYIQQLNQQSEILEKQAQRESIKIYFIFLFIPISTIILLFLKTEKTKNIVLNILLVCNTLLFLFPAIGAVFESQSGLHWLYIFLLPLCFIIQLVLVVLKIVFYVTKNKHNTTN